VVISILGILAALTMPALKNFAKSDATISASRQLLDDVGRARQLAISQRTTVYMVFCADEFLGSQLVGHQGAEPRSRMEQPDPGAANRRDQFV